VSPRESVRGVGRDHAGATDVTMRIWYALQQASEPGLTVEDIEETVGPNVPPGYAWRRYVRRRRSAGGNGVAPALRDTPVARTRALHYVITDSLNSMVKWHTAIRRPDGYYVVGPRKPKSVFTDEVHDFDGSVSRRAVADMELARVVGPILQHIDDVRERRRNLPTISVKLEFALRQWYRAQPASHR